MIPLWGCVAAGNTLLRLDDLDTFTDEGSAMAPEFTVGTNDLGPAGGYGTLRKIVQAVAIGGPTTLEITPIGDGQIYEDQAQTFVLTTTGGMEQIVDCFAQVPATRFGYRVRVTSVGGPASFGENDRFVIPRRTMR